MNRSIRRLYLALSAGFMLLVLLLGYWQVIAAPGLRDDQANGQRLQRERLIDRGRIISADGKVLATSRATRVRGQRVFARRYPQGSLAAHAVGYISDSRGKTGVEGTYDRFLSGSFGTEPLLQRLNVREKRGADVRLFLDTRVQRVAEDQLSGLRGAVVAIDPETGGVIAMASAPTFDLSKVSSDFAAITSTEGAPLLSRATSGRYPPGSTFKVVTASAALQSGLYAPGDQFDDTGALPTPGGAIRNFSGSVYGVHTLQTALTNSINTTFARVAQAVGGETLGGTMAAYGFGEPPPIDLPQEQVAASGRRDADDALLPNIAENADLARIGIGQEQLAVTPLQMAMVAAGVANGGTVRAPRMMSRVTDRGGAVVAEAERADVGQPLSPENAAALAGMMQDVVNSGTGTAAALTGLEVAGKTGTAETSDPGKNQAWFIGFAPVDDPKVAVAVVIEDTSGTGGVVAAPVAGAVMDAALKAAG